MNSVIAEVSPPRKFIVRETDGMVTFESCGLITGGIHRTNLPRGFVMSDDRRPTTEARASFWKLTESAPFSRIFPSAGENGKKEWTKAQVVQFYQDYPAKFVGRSSIFFRLAENVVAQVCCDEEGRTKINLELFDENHHYVWDHLFNHEFGFLE